jgi:hypothetical protein
MLTAGALIHHQGGGSGEAQNPPRDGVAGGNQLEPCPASRRDVRAVPSAGARNQPGGRDLAGRPLIQARAILRARRGASNALPRPLMELSPAIQVARPGRARQRQWKEPWVF